MRVHQYSNNIRRCRSRVLAVTLLAGLFGGCHAVPDGVIATNQSLGMSNGMRSAGPVPYDIQQRAASAMTTSQSRETARMIASARPAIENMIGLVACGADSKRMARYTDPSSSTGLYLRPQTGMTYHKSGCLNPVRVAGWEKLSANAIRFEVDYVSPQSEEGTRQRYTAVQQPGGEWLFKWTLWKS